MMWTLVGDTFVSEPVGAKEWRVIVRPEWIDPVPDGGGWVGLLEAPGHPLDYNVLGGRLAGWGRTPEIVMSMSEQSLATYQELK